MSQCEEAPALPDPVSIHSTAQSTPRATVPEGEAEHFGIDHFVTVIATRDFVHLK